MKPYYVGEVIRSNLVNGYHLYDVVSVDKSTWEYPEGWNIVIKSKVDGEHYNFCVSDGGLWELITPVEERLWNL